MMVPHVAEALIVMNNNAMMVIDMDPVFSCTFLDSEASDSNEKKRNEDGLSKRPRGRRVPRYNKVGYIHFFSCMIFRPTLESLRVHPLIRPFCNYQ